MTAERIPHVPKVPVAKEDLIAAWSVLEDLAVSLHRISSSAASGIGRNASAEDHQRMLEELDQYLSPERYAQINDARTRLGEYLPDDEAEAISERSIKYWNGNTARPNGR